MVYLKCPNCGFLIEEKLFNQARYDYYCARCEKNKLSEFQTVEYKEEKNEQVD